MSKTSISFLLFLNLYDSYSLQPSAIQTSRSWTSTDSFILLLVIQFLLRQIEERKSYKLRNSFIGPCFLDRYLASSIMSWTCCQPGCGMQNGNLNWCQGCQHYMCDVCQRARSTPAPAAGYGNRPASWGGNASTGWNIPNVLPAPPPYGYYDRPPPSPYGPSNQEVTSISSGQPSSFQNANSFAAPAPATSTTGSTYVYPHTPYSTVQQAQAYEASSSTIPNAYRHATSTSAGGNVSTATAGSTHSQGSDNRDGTSYSRTWTSGGSEAHNQSRRS